MRVKDIREAASLEDCDKAWSEGYINGYTFVRGTVPAVPPTPALPSGISDPVGYYRKLGREHGVADAMATKPKLVL